jgi:transcriptional regulator with XRE-family HTH domain
MKQKELATRLGISDPYLSQILLGNRRPKLELLALIQDTTGVPVGSWVDNRRSDLDRPTEVGAE